MKLHNLLFAVPFALLVASCGTEAGQDAENALENAGNDIENAADRAGDAMADATTVEIDAEAGGALNETVAAVQSAGGDITAIPPAAAVSNIDGWIGRLKGKDGTYEIVQGLENLKEALTDDDGIDGVEVGSALNELAEDIREKNNPALAPLANALAAGGDKLGGL